MCLNCLDFCYKFCFQSLRDIEEDLEVPSDTDNDLQKVLDLLTSKEDEEPASDQLFFIDKGRSSSDMGVRKHL